MAKPYDGGLKWANKLEETRDLNQRIVDLEISRQAKSQLLDDQYEIRRKHEQRIDDLEKKLAVFNNPDNWEFEQTDDEFGEWIWRGYHDPIGSEKEADV